MSTKRAAALERISKYNENAAYPGLTKALIGAYGRVRIPSHILSEIKTAADKLDLHWHDALLLNLDYELGGGACTTAAVPGKRGYRMVRALDWEIPAAFANSIRWKPLVAGVSHRKVPHYSGVLTGHNFEDHFGVALNQSDDPYGSINILGLPIAWHIRLGLEESYSIDDMLNYLLKAKPIVGGYVTLIGKERAYWLNVTAQGGYIHYQVDFPAYLCVCNDTKEGKDEMLALKKWNKRGRKGGVPFPVAHTDTVDLVSLSV